MANEPTEMVPSSQRRAAYTIMPTCSESVATNWNQRIRSMNQNVRRAAFTS